MCSREICQTTGDHTRCEALRMTPASRFGRLLAAQQPFRVYDERLCGEEAETYPGRAHQGMKWVAESVPAYSDDGIVMQMWDYLRHQGKWDLGQ